jgi:hypothetical protein
MQGSIHKLQGTICEGCELQACTRMPTQIWKEFCRRSRSCSTEVPAIPAQQATRCRKRAHRGALLFLGRSAVASMHCRAQERLVQRRRAPLRNEQLAASVRKLFGCIGTGKRVSASVHLPFASAGRAPGTALQHCARLHSAEQRGRNRESLLSPDSG